MTKFDISNWVEAQPDQKSFRQAVHIILAAISENPDLNTNMVMKGGMLLAIGYDSSRYTKDIDFSTNTELKDFDRDNFIIELENSLVAATERLSYGLDCRVQTHNQQPPGDDKTFPTIQITIGYAYNSDVSAHRRLLAKQSPNIVRVDYSLNESIGEPELFEVSDGHSVRAYSLDVLVAEKFRALLQQERRKRIRRQDIYDLYFLLRNCPVMQEETYKYNILDCLHEKASARDLIVQKDSMRNPEIERRSKLQYASLISEIDGELPNFDEAYETVRSYYECLPWQALD